MRAQEWAHLGVSLLLLGSTVYFMATCFHVPIAMLGVYVVNRRTSQRLADAALGSWWKACCWVIEEFNGIDLHFRGDDVPYDEDAIIIMNHTCTLDWMFVWCLGLRKGGISKIKNLLKDSLKHIPVFGWSFYLGDFVFVKRNWALDQASLKHSLSMFVADDRPIWLLIFPEGTRMSLSSAARCRDFCRERGLDELHHVNYPKTKAFIQSVQSLQHSARVKVIYDLTVAYEPSPLPKSIFVSFLAGRVPSAVYLHVRRHELTAIPKEDEALHGWCVDRFYEKDKLLAGFAAHGDFKGSNPLDAAMPLSEVYMALALLIGGTLVALYLLATTSTFKWLLAAINALTLLRVYLVRGNSDRHHKKCN